MFDWINQAFRGKSEQPADSAESLANQAIKLKTQANALWAQGDLVAAEALYRQAIAINPRFAEAHNNLGALLREVGRLDEAESCLHKAISANGKLANAYYNLGQLQEQRREAVGALISFERSIELDPKFVSAYINAAGIHTREKRFEDAVNVLKSALEVQSDSFDILINLGQALHVAGQIDQAEACCRRAMALRPDQSEPYVGLAAILADSRQFEQATNYLKQAVALKPDLSTAYFNLGVIARTQADFASAREYLQLAITYQPDYAEAHNELGVVLQQLEMLDEARASFEKALDCKPEYAIASNNLGLVFWALGKLRKAQLAFEAAIELDVDYIDPYINLGNICGAAGFFVEAANCYRKALEFKPDEGAVYHALGNALYSQGEMEQAQEQYRHAIRLHPNSPEARFALAVATLPAVFKVGDNPLTIREAFARSVAELDIWADRELTAGGIPLVVTQPFYLAYQECDNRALLSQYGGLLARLTRNWLDMGDCVREPPAPAGIIRLGMVSGHIRNQSVWTAIVKGWCQFLDRSAFELHVFHLSPLCDEETEWAKAQVKSFRQCPKDLRSTTREIWAKNLDILIYPEIGMEPVAVTLASQRLARVQVATWGHPETTGLPTIDYYLSAEDFEPANGQDFYSERLVSLPHLGCCYQPLGTSDLVPDFEQLGIDVSRPILLCPGTLQKYAPQHDHIWPEIARRLKSGQLIFFAGKSNNKSSWYRERLSRAFANVGLSLESHVVFVPWLNGPNFFGLMKRSTAMLDTIGFSGFNTAMQAVECGLPMVTREGRFMRGRLASGILRRMEITELIAADEAAYVELAVRLVQDNEFNQSMRSRIEAAKPLVFGDVMPIRAMETFFRQLCQATK